ncbi:MAG: Nif3-like dinuclear metal center hexameric protein [Bacteroidaceae bacterium]|nr:Nif3-like dinuclear metal center hexameric protein [Bacteroidaceae bacterium]
MSVKVKEVIDALEHFAPLPLQESYDNAGLQTGLTEAEVSGALLCLDVTEEVMREAVELGCNLIVSHHPVLFRGLRQVSDATQVQRVVRMAVQNDIAIYSAHTNLDKAEDGVNYKIAERLGLIDVTPIGQCGVMGYLSAPMDSRFFLDKVKEVFHCACLMHNSVLPRPVQSVAVCGGAGEDLLGEALAQEADAFLTGEMRYHTCMGHDEEILICVLGHYESERYTVELLEDILAVEFPHMPLYKTEINTNPIHYLY